MKALQFGEGNFLRAFVDWMVDIANAQGVTDVQIGIVPPRFRNKPTLEALNRQGMRYHTILEGIEHGEPKREIREISCVAEAFAPADDFPRYLEWVCDPQLRFVFSNTTEAGIRYEADDANLDIPASFPAKVASMLYRRYRHFNGDKSKGLIFLPCELIEDNGQQLKEIVLRQSREAGFEPEFMQWVGDSCIFCDTLVDRIVSGAPKEPVPEVAGDDAAVVGELFHLWVIGGPDAERVKEELPLHLAGHNVLFLPSIKSFRDKKVKLLNGSHTAMVPIGLQLGHETVLQAFTDSRINRFINSMVATEVIPSIPESPAELQQFANSILERFLNPYIKHRLESIALNSLSKWETRNWCSAADYVKVTGRIPEHILFSFAALMSLYGPESGFTPNDNAEHIAVIRDNWNPDNFEATVKAALSAGIFSNDFCAVIPDFCHKTAKYLDDIRSMGMDKAVERFLDEHK